MADVAHSGLTDPNLHEPKGVAAAGAEEVYVADGAGSGEWRKLSFKLEATISPQAISANTTEEETFTVNGAVLATDVCVGVSKPTHQAGLGIVGWRVTADNSIAITFMNTTAGEITPTASETYSFVLHRESA